MAGTFNLRIATPEREVFNGMVESVSLPGLDGRFGILRNHAPLVAALDAGLVDVYDADGQEIRIAIGGGFFEVLTNEAILLADSAEFSQDIDLARAREAEQRARSRLAGQVEPEHLIQRERANAALKRAQNRLRVASGR
jgi:F-type H+-transporting ATPase subunit epsilon